MVERKQKLELTWIGKERQPKLEPRILLEDSSKSYHAKHRMGEDDFFDNILIQGDNLLGLKALEQEYAGKVKCVFIDPPYNTGSAFGFSGVFDDDGKNMNLQRVYLETGKPINVKPGEDGICKILSKDDHFTGLFCAAKIDEDGRRTVPLVGFDLSPNQ